MDAFGTSFRKLKKHIGRTGTETKIADFQKTAIIYSTKISIDYINVPTLYIYVSNKTIKAQK